jgi:predicted nucleic acid-binding Zn ribbon protein
MAKPVRVGDALNKMLKSLGLDKYAKQAEAAQVWPEVVGERIAEVTQVVTVENGVMRVSVRDSLWIQELSFLKNEIISRLNERLGDEIIKDIRLR